MTIWVSAGTGKDCAFGHLGLVFIWSCFVLFFFFLLFYVIPAPVLAEAADYICLNYFHLNLNSIEQHGKLPSREVLLTASQRK